MPSSPTWSNTLVHVMDPNLYAGTDDVYLGSVFFDINEYPYWYTTLKTTTTVYPPAPHIGINGSIRSGTVYLSHTSWLTVTAGLDANGFAGTEADWWVVAVYHGAPYYYRNGSWITAYGPTWQKPVANWSQTQVWSSGIAAGDSVTFYVGVDLARNGVLDNPYHYTYVTVIGL